ncbi:MAG TPA: energy transducer TonB [Candidatus Xenobia bacterium]|nr:energy transducer TonB [Candidatus Xenobia bacterium]
MSEPNRKTDWQPHLLEESEPLFKTILGTIKTFLSEPMGGRAASLPRGAMPHTPGYRLDVEIEPWHKALPGTLRDALHPEKLPPLPAKPIKVADIWNLGLYAGQFRRSELYSALLHATVLALFALPFLITPTEAKQPQAKVTELVELGDLGQYKVTLPPSTKKSGGGGGGGERNPLKASKGRLPKFSLNAQLTPPAAVIRNPNPRLAAEPTVVVPPDIHIQSPNMTAYGDPASTSLIPSSGPGFGGGIGTGSGGGVGSGSGPGVGPGHGGGYGGGVFRIGGSVSAPTCIYCPDPEFSDEARKARYQGVVVLLAVVDEEGRARDIRVARSLGMGLDEQAIRAVQNWRFKPAERYGKPVPVYMTIEVNFRLF